MPVVKTFCRFCHAMCGIEVQVEDGRPVKVLGDRDNEISQGYTCIKGRNLPAQHEHEARLREPLARGEDGTFEPIDREAALDSIAAGIAGIIAEHGPRAVAVYAGTAAFQNSLTMPLARAFSAALGTPSFYTSLTIDQPNKIAVDQHILRRKVRMNHAVAFRRLRQSTEPLVNGLSSAQHQLVLLGGGAAVIPEAPPYGLFTGQPISIPGMAHEAFRRCPVACLVVHLGSELANGCKR